MQLSGHFNGKIRPQIIIGADGPHSIVSRAMGNPVQETGICLEYEMADVNIDAEAAEMYFSAHYAPGGYAWIIPLGQDMANVGVGVRASYLAGQKLPHILDRFIREHPIAAEKLAGGEVLAVMRGLVPAGGTQLVLFKKATCFWREMLPDTSWPPAGEAYHWPWWREGLQERWQ